MPAFRVCLSGFLCDSSGYGEATRRYLDAFRTVQEDIDLSPGLVLSDGGWVIPADPWLQHFLKAEPSGPAEMHLIFAAAADFDKIRPQFMSAPRVGMTCVLPDQLVTTRRGHIKIQDIRVDDYVLTHRRRWRRVTKLLQRDYNGPVIGMGSTDGMQGTKCRTWLTPDHPVLRQYRKKSYRWNPQKNRWTWEVSPAKPESPDWVSVSSVEGGDLILLPTYPLGKSASFLCLRSSVAIQVGHGYVVAKNRWGQPAAGGHRLPERLQVDPELAEVLGLYVAEGSTPLSRHETKVPAIVSFAFNERDLGLQQFVESVMMKRFGIAPSRGRSGRGASLRFSSRILAETFDYEFGRGSESKRAPWWLLETSHEIVCAFVRGLFKGDGHRNKKGQSWNLTTVSRELAWQTLDLLRSLGFYASLTHYVTSRKKTERRAYRIHVSKNPEFDELMAGRVYCSPSKEMWVAARHSLQSEYSGLVYNLEVDEDESYVVEGIAVHNCWESDRLHQSTLEGCRTVDYVIVPSHHNATVFRGAGIDAKVVPFPVVLPPAYSDELPLREIEDISPETFVFTSIMTWQERKNPVGLLAAYCTAFTKDDDVELVIKVSGPDPDSAHRMADQMTKTVLATMALRDTPRIRLIKGRWNSANLWAFHQRADCYVSLTRGEAFGIPLMDAAAMGNRVIVTGYGGHCDFLPEATTRKVRYRMAPVLQRYTHFDGRQRWADPDVLHAAELMRQEYERGRQPKILSDLSEFLPTSVGKQLREVLIG